VRSVSSQDNMSIDGSLENYSQQKTNTLENDPSHLDTIAEDPSDDNRSQNKESDVPETSTTSALPSKHSGESTSTNKTSSKKQKANKEDSLKLKKLINELLSIEKPPQIIEVTEEGVSGDANNYLYFFNKIDFAESKNIITNQEVIGSYFDFGGVLYKRYKDLKKDNGKEASNALVFEEVRKQIPKEVTDVALRKRMERV
ncbi:13861_t:CDS:1, partial [Entrophospora sp. SA101]